MKILSTIRYEDTSRRRQLVTENGTMAMCNKFHPRQKEEQSSFEGEFHLPFDWSPRFGKPVGLAKDITSHELRKQFLVLMFFIDNWKSIGPYYRLYDGEKLHH